MCAFEPRCEGLKSRTRHMHTFRAMSSRLSRSGPPMLKTLCCRDARLLITSRTMAMMSCAQSASFNKSAAFACHGVHR